MYRKQVTIDWILDQQLAGQRIHRQRPERVDGWKFPVCIAEGVTTATSVKGLAFVVFRVNRIKRLVFRVGADADLRAGRAL